jgi:hypothetical protein
MPAGPAAAASQAQAGRAVRGAWLAASLVGMALRTARRHLGTAHGLQTTHPGLRPHRRFLLLPRPAVGAAAAAAVAVAAGSSIVSSSSSSSPFPPLPLAAHPAVSLRAVFSTGGRGWLLLPVGATAQCEGEGACVKLGCCCLVTAVGVLAAAVTALGRALAQQLQVRFLAFYLVLGLVGQPGSPLQHPQQQAPR